MAYPSDHSDWTRRFRLDNERVQLDFWCVFVVTRTRRLETGTGCPYSDFGTLRSLKPDCATSSRACWAVLDLGPVETGLALAI